MDLRYQADREDARLAERLDRLVPELMRREGVDAWVLIGREYAEDPVLRTMLPSTWLSARRRTILVLLAVGTTVRRLAISRYPVGDLFEAAWDPDRTPDQWQALAELLATHDPHVIAIGVAPGFAHADGLTHSQYRALVGALPHALRDRVVSGEALGVGWLETRLPEERGVYGRACEVGHGLIHHVLSDEVIHPGRTTTTDVEWAYRELAADLHLPAWFHPAVSVQRPDRGRADGFATKPATEVIEPGDLVHIDAGIVWDRLCTDQQQHAYVLRDGEDGPPEGLRQALATANRLQDLLLAEMVPGRTGNEVLASTLSQAQAEGIDAAVYTHPIGLHGHGAGPMIGMWDQQHGVPGAGDLALRPDTVFSIELNAAVDVPGWGRVQLMLEEEAWLGPDGPTWLAGRQTELLLV